jgi:hypothetical protein
VCEGADADLTLDPGAHDTYAYVNRRVDNPAAAARDLAAAGHTTGPEPSHSD